MATNLEKLKKKKEINLKKESDLSTSYAIEIAPEEEKVPVKNIVPIALVNKPEILSEVSSFDGSEKSLGLRLASEEDKRYFDMAPLGMGISKKAFFINLMQREFDSVDSININDPEISEFRTSSLKTVAITILVPEALIEKIKQYSAMHMMKYQRYVAYVIHKARINDSNWKL